MRYTSFAEYVQMREGLLLPDRPVTPAGSRINTTPFTKAQLKRLKVKPIKAPDPFQPTIKPVGGNPIPSLPKPKKSPLNANEGLWMNDDNAIEGLSKRPTPKPPTKTKPKPASPPKLKPIKVPSPAGSQGGGLRLAPQTPKPRQKPIR